jgi:hypothetical protein
VDLVKGNLALPRGVVVDVERVPRVHMHSVAGVHHMQRADDIGAR